VSSQEELGERECIQSIWYSSTTKTHNISLNIMLEEIFMIVSERKEEEEETEWIKIEINIIIFIAMSHSHSLAAAVVAQQIFNDAHTN
jgi:hypothetical protein